MYQTIFNTLLLLIDCFKLAICFMLWSQTERWNLILFGIRFLLVTKYRNEYPVLRPCEVDANLI